MGSIRKFIWRIIWLFSFCTLGITVIYKDGVVIKLESIWGEVEDNLDAPLDSVVKTKVDTDYWDVK